MRDLNTNTGVTTNCVGGLAKGSDEERANSSQSSGHHEISHHNHHGRGRDRSRGRNNQGGSSVDLCTPKMSEDTSMAGCALFGLTNIKVFISLLTKK